MDVKMVASTVAVLDMQMVVPMVSCLAGKLAVLKEHIMAVWKADLKGNN